MSKKISIITLHHVTNYGSLLQSYALQKYLNDLGHEVEYIDFVPYGLTLKAALFPQNDKRSFLKKAVRFFPCLCCNLVETWDMNRFLNKYISLTNKTYRSYHELEAASFNADVYMNGSDQVWNIQNANDDDDLKAYLLCFAPKDAKRISYAGSFGREQIKDNEKELFKEAFSAYSAISVREDSAKNIIENLGFSNVKHVLDPTLTLTKDDWKEIAKKRLIKDDYILVYNLNRNPKIKEDAMVLSEKTGLKIVNFADTFDFIKGAKNRLHNKPEDFLSLFMYASYVLTDSFHGTAFSINFNRTFMTYPAPKYNSRIESVLRMFDLEKRFVSGNVTVECIDNPIDFSKVNSKLSQEREFAKQFIVEGLQ